MIKALKELAETNDNAIALISNETILKMIAVIEAAEIHKDGMCWCDDHTAMNGESGLCNSCKLDRAFRELEKVQNREAIR